MEKIEREMEWMKATVQQLADGQKLMQTAIKELTDVVASIAEVKHDIERHDDEIKLMRSRYHEQATFLSARPCHKHGADIERLIDRADMLETRVMAIETHLPTVEMASSWLFRGVLGLVSMLAMLSIGILAHWAKGGFST